MQPNEKNPKIHTEHWVQSEPPKSFLTDASTIGAIAGSIFGAAIGTVAGGATLAGLLDCGRLLLGQLVGKKKDLGALQNHWYILVLGVLAFIWVAVETLVKMVFAVITYTP